MKTQVRVLALAGVVVVLGFGAWLLFRAPGEPAPPTDESAERTREVVVPPPVLRPGERKPLHEPIPDDPRESAPDVRLTLRVLDDARGRVLEGADVHVFQGEEGPRTFRTNRAGEVDVPGLQAGEVLVVARAPGLVRAEARRELSAGEPTTVELRLVRGVRLEGTVVAARSGHPIPDARVVVHPGGSLDGWTEMNMASPFGAARTDDRGRFVVEGVASDLLVSARATAEGYGVASESLRLPAASDDPPQVVLRLPPAVALEGTVRTPGGAPAVGARVYAVPADAPEMLLADPESQVISGGRPFRSLRGVSGADGAFRIDGLELGAVYVVFAELEGHGRSARQEDVMATEDDPRPRVDLVLQGAASLTVHVWSPDGEPQEEGALSLFGEGFPLRAAPVSPGVFAVQGPPPGTYTLRVSCPGAVVQEVDVEIAAAEQKEIEVRLERGLVLAGVLVDDTGRPVAHQKLFVDRPWQEASKHPLSKGTAETDAEGRFVVGGLREGPHTLGLVLARHVVPDDLRLEPPAENLRIVVLRKAAFRARLQPPAGFTPPETVAIRVGRAEDGGYSESGHGVPWNEGELNYDGLVPGELRLRIQVEGLLEVVRNLTLKPGEVVDLGTIALEEGFVLEGRVVDGEDRPVAGARVTAGEVWTPTHRAVVTGADGRFVLPTLRRGENEIEIAADGFLRQTVTVAVREEIRGRTFVLDRGCLVTLRVAEADGKPAPARRLRWRADPKPGEADTPTDWEETNAKGELQVRLREGTWTIELLDDEWSAILSREVDLTEGGSETVELTLPR